MNVATNNPDLQTEWLLTNGLGGYAMGTACGANTRRYHGLLNAAMAPPVQRVVTLHSTIDQFHPDGNEENYVPLSTQIFGNEQTLHPEGWRMQTEFTCDTRSAVWTWKTDQGVTIRRTLTLEQGRNSAVLKWVVEGASAGSMLSIRPLAVFRDHNKLLDRIPADFHSFAEGERCVIQRDMNALELSADVGDWQTLHQWWNNFDYPVETSRGQDHVEHAFCGGVLRVPLSDQSMTVTLNLTMQESSAAITTNKAAEKSADSSTAGRLADACEQFIVTRGSGEGMPYSVIAGYPWFVDWGRDSLISLPGLFLKHGRLDDAISLLNGFAGRIKRGIIPNRFDDNGEEAYYNTADASLWFMNAVHACFTHAGGEDGHDDLPQLIDTCRSIVSHYRRGTDFGIRIDFDGLVMAGVPGEAVTWMDARVNGQGVTARIGKPVELSALWYNGLCGLARMVDDPTEAAGYQAAAALARKSFQERFWNQADSCCYDLLMPGHGNWRGDNRIRPNQIFAISLPWSPLSGDQARKVLACVRKHLLTPFGLRTLSPQDPCYQGRYEGDMESRDRAYHNGTVWPWLIGPYCDAIQKQTDDPASADQQIRQLLKPLVDSLDSGCLGQIAEIYDGDQPHDPHGCPAQAWSTAEVARSWPDHVEQAAATSTNSGHAASLST